MRVSGARVGGVRTDVDHDFTNARREVGILHLLRFLYRTS